MYHFKFIKPKVNYLQSNDAMIHLKKEKKKKQDK